MLRVHWCCRLTAILLLNCAVLSVWEWYKRERISTLINRPEVSWGRRVFYYLKDRVGSAGKCSRRSRGGGFWADIANASHTFLPSPTHTHTEAGTLSHARLALGRLPFLFVLSLWWEGKIKIASLQCVCVCVGQELTARAALCIRCRCNCSAKHVPLWQTSPRLLLLVLHAGARNEKLNRASL